jgi:hypothetical protein
MYTRCSSSARLDGAVVMLARSHVQDLERDIERIHLAELARASHPRHSAPRPALLTWLCAALPRQSRRPHAGAPPAAVGELASAGAGQQ